jgi:hypothetical protein
LGGSAGLVKSIILECLSLPWRSINRIAPFGYLSEAKNSATIFSQQPHVNTLLVILFAISPLPQFYESQLTRLLNGSEPASIADAHLSDLIGQSIKIERIFKDIKVSGRATDYPRLHIKSLKISQRLQAFFG